MRLYLVGFMGAGKTTVGRALSEHLRWPFVDLDEMVEARSGLVVAEIFDRRGESTFRRWESEALRETAAWSDVVVATGGGTYVSPENADFIERHGMSLWINPSWESIIERLVEAGEAGRPLLADEAQSAALLAARRPAYERCDLIVEVPAGEAVRATVSRIVDMLPEGRCAI